MNEWMIISDYEGYYQISATGAIRSLDRTVKRGRGGLVVIKAKDMIIQVDENGYNYVKLNKLGKSKSFKIHVLVAKAFISNPLNKPFVNHKDGNKNNNNVNNLEWCTQSENEKHAHKTGLKNHKGENHPNHRLTDEIVIAVRDMFENKGISQREIGRKLGLNYKTINKIVHRQRWAHI